MRICKCTVILVFLTAATGRFVHAVNVLQKVTFEEDDINAGIQLHYSKKIVYNEIILLGNPYRILVDFKDKKVYCSLINQTVNKGIINEVRYTYKKKNLLSILFFIPTEK